MIHVSDLIHVNQCPRLAWKLNRHIRQAEPYANEIYSFASVYVPFLQVEDWPEGQPYDSSDDSLKILKEHVKGRNLRFEYEGIRCKIPVLEKLEDGTYKAIYPLKTITPKDKELPLFFWNAWIAAKAGIHISQHEIVYINGNYTQGEEEPLLIKENRLMKKKGIFFEQTIDEMLQNLKIHVDNQIEWVRKATQNEEPEPQRCKSCSAPRRCSFYDECFETDQLPDDSLLHLCSSSKRQKIYDQGARLLTDIKPYLLEGLPMQYAQIQAAKSESGLFVDHKGLDAFLKDLEYPLIYLDFEWDTFLFPPYKGMKPFDVLCFQSSMHVEQEDGTLNHYSFFELGDCRKNFLDHLFEHLPEKGTILVYNMEGAEKLRLEQLARQFPEYQEQVDQAVGRMRDLSLPFEHGLFYDLRQRGKSSLKSILPLFAGEDKYKHLEVGNGLDAIAYYRKASQSSDLQQQQAIGQAISDYCAMDTMAEYDVLHGLKRLAGKE